jgi:hypothetical protein
VFFDLPGGGRSALRRGEEVKSLPTYNPASEVTKARKRRSATTPPRYS